MKLLGLPLFLIAVFGILVSLMIFERFSKILDLSGIF